MVATNLTAGNIAIIGFNFDNPDQFSFVLLADIGIDTQIKFTDDGVKSDGSFRGQEGLFTWTADQNYTAGQIITVDSTGIALSSQGDQIIAYQGSSSNPTFLYALNSQGSRWQSNATNKRTSALPSGLIDGEAAIALNEIDNAVYTGMTSGTKAELLTAISDTNNWTGSNRNRQSLPSGNFNVNNSSGNNSQSNVWINESHYDNSSTDVNEGIEIAGLAGTDLSGWTIELYNGNNGSIYSTINLNGSISDLDSGFGTKFFAESRIQNGPDGFALIDNSGNVVQFLSYEGSFVATSGSASGLTSIDIGVAESNSTAVGSSLQLSGTGTNYEDFTWTNPSINTYDAINNGQSFSSSGGSGGGNTNSIHLSFGNPSNAVVDVNVTDNYLLIKDQFAMSYNDNTRIANWVGWQLNDSWIGSAPRQNDFRADSDLPAGFFQVGSGDYSSSGFDRGHVIPSADRTATIADNSATFVMTNMIPQAPSNNRGVWASFENHVRTLLTNKDVYIYAGGYGVGGDGSNGFATSIGPNITVPAQTWKTILVVDSGETSVNIGTDDYTITIDIPNSQSVSGASWQDYAVSVDEIEISTGYDFFSELPDNIESVLESTGSGSYGGSGNEVNIFINEIHYDNNGSDVNEGVEIAGVAGVDLNGFSLEFYNGNGGTVYNSENLTGVIPNQDNGYGTIFFPVSGIQNGAPDGLALVDDNGSAIQFLSYEGELIASDGSANGMTSIDIGVSETSSTSVGNSLQLIGSGNSYNDFFWTGADTNSYDLVNVGQSFV